MESIRRLRAALTRVLATTEENYGPAHYETAVALHNLAALVPELEHARRDTEALAACERALPVLERLWGLTHPATTACATNLELLRQRHGHGTRELIGAGDDASRP
jgi:hypothetical protein